MKKLWLFLIIVFCVVGCDKNNFKESLENTKKLNSYNMTLKTSIKGDNTDEIISFDIDNINKTGIINFKYNDESVIQYIKDDKVYSKYENGDIWYYSENKNLNLGIFDNVKTKKLKEKGKYEITLPKENLSSILDDYIVDYDNIKSYVFTNNDLISKLVLDVPVAITDSNNVINKLLNVEIEFSKYNELSLTIPESVLESGIDQTIIDLQNMAEKYAFEVEVYLWDNNVTDTVFTDTSIKYTGDTPTNVNLIVKEGLIESGTIDLNGYKFTLQNGNVTNYEKLTD